MIRIREVLGKNIRQGSAVVGVLVAMTFVGIVVSAMLKSTGSHSAAAISHGAVMTMNSTVSSGLVATESFFWDKGPRALDTLRRYMESMGGSFNGIPADAFIFGAANRKTAIANDQHFNSQVTKLKQTNDTTFFAQFEVNAGRNSGAKTLRKATAFYQLENLKFEEENTFGGSNSMFLGGPLVYGNNGMIVKGTATYTQRFESQNKKPLRFEPDSCGNGSVYFNDEFEIRNDTVAFQVPAYFHKRARFQNIANTFKDSVFQNNVGFNNNVSFVNNEIGISNGNVWMNGRFLDPNNNFNVKDYIKNTNPSNGKSFYYTDALRSLGDELAVNALSPWWPLPEFCTQPLFGPPCASGTISSPGMCEVDNCYNPHPFVSNVDNLPLCSPPPPYLYGTPQCTKRSGLAQVPNCPASSPLFPNVCVPPGQFNQFNTSAANNPIRNFAADKVERSPTGGDWPIVTRLGIDSLPCRQEPDLDISRIDSSLYLSNAQAIKCLNGGGVGRIDAAAMDSCMKDASLPRYRDHIVINWNSAIRNAMQDAINMPSTKFNGKVIFIVNEPNIPFRGPLYNSSDTSSTLVYVGPNGKLDNFGVGNNHHFNGLIYIHPDNNFPGNQHTLKWGDSSSVSGAILSKGQTNIQWNSGGNDGKPPTRIERDNKVLSNYGSLVDCSSMAGATGCREESCPPGAGGNSCVGGGDASLEFKDASVQRIITRSLGIYFH